MIKCHLQEGRKFKDSKKVKVYGKVLRQSTLSLSRSLSFSLPCSLFLPYLSLSLFVMLCMYMCLCLSSKPSTLFISQTICLRLSLSLFIILSMDLPSSFSLNHPPSSFPDYLSPSLSVPLHHTLYVSAFVFLSKPPTFFLPRLSVSISLCPSSSYSLCICFRLSL